MRTFCIASNHFVNGTLLSVKIVLLFAVNCRRQSAHLKLLLLVNRYIFTHRQYGHTTLPCQRFCSRNNKQLSSVSHIERIFIDLKVSTRSFYEPKIIGDIGFDNYIMIFFYPHLSDRRLEPMFRYLASSRL